MKIIKVYKDKQFLVFDLENGKTVKYDFSKKKAIGINDNYVKNLRKQLNGLTISKVIEYCEDKQYGKFLEFIQKNYAYNISNIGTILSHVPDYEKYEQLFSAGLYDIDKNFHLTINEIPNSLIKHAKTRNIHLSNDFCKFWIHNIDAYNLAYQLEYISLTNDDIYNILNANYYDRLNHGYISYYNTLIDEYGYNAKSLLLYLDQLMTFEAITNMATLMRELKDYAYMMNSISKKFDKYPRNFLTTHCIACRNYNRLRRDYSEELFHKKICKKFEYSYGKYKFLYPSCTQDIKDEAVQQNNCVASYIDKVLDGKCHILFLRKKDSLDKSLVTIEVNAYTNTIVQAKGKFNRDTTEEENKVIEAWNKKYSKRKDVAA